MLKLARSGSSKWVAAALVAVVTMAVGSVARAGNVSWSVGAHVAPGVSLNVGNAPYYYAPPVYVAPAPVYYAPQPVYYATPSYYVRPAPVYYGTTVVYSRGYHRGHGKRHHRHRH